MGIDSRPPLPNTPPRDYPEIAQGEGSREVDQEYRVNTNQPELSVKTTPESTPGSGSDLVQYPFPLRSGVMAYLSLPAISGVGRPRESQHLSPVWQSIQCQNSGPVDPRTGDSARFENTRSMAHPLLSAPLR
jgi:hypothetical protein